MADDGLGQISVPAGWPVASPVPRKTARVGQSLVHGPLAFGRALLDLVYPPGCMACARPTAASGGLCAPCWTRLRFVTPPLCDRLGTPLPLDLGPGLLSPEALANPPVYRRCRAVACFDEGPAQALVHRLKYGDRPDYARALGLWMAQAGASLLDEADVVVPIPLHPRRLWQRRFNQAAQLARSVSRAADKPLDLDGLVRVKATLSQVGMRRAQRAENIQGAFRVAPAAAGRFRDRRVVLVDDVLTTGATVNAASRVLLRDGAATVDVLVFARVVTTG